ncbi:MAG: enoyl-CoA hydratase/isomerase family protein [Proteobacteria bacterium]|nr:enoyl-CoA hydratase/isomerase family protein [Pseudomonadota bacterium]
MDYINSKSSGGITTLEMNRGKVNALNEILLKELSDEITRLEKDDDTQAIIITGEGKFFSFGFDIPEIYKYDKTRFTDYIINFTKLFSKIFIYPKPIIAALNGHTIAGGCVLAIACDQRIMADNNSKISMNELSFGSSVMTGIVEILRFATGGQNASKILLSGEMFTAQNALEMNLIDEIVPEDLLIERSQEIAKKMGSMSQPGFSSIKNLLRRPVVDQFDRDEGGSISEFVDIWYSEEVRNNLKNITIR